jgi:hypothetical protein
MKINRVPQLAYWMYGIFNLTFGFIYVAIVFGAITLNRVLGHFFTWVGLSILPPYTYGLFVVSAFLAPFYAQVRFGKLKINSYALALLMLVVDFAAVMLVSDRGAGVWAVTSHLLFSLGIFMWWVAVALARTVASFRAQQRATKFAEQVGRLAKLRETGSLTPEEFEYAKAKLFNS